MAHLKKVKREIDRILRMEMKKPPPKLSADQAKDFGDPTVPCHICEKPVTCTLTGQDYRTHLHRLEGLDKLGPAVRDHDHVTGKLRGKAHYKCNQDYRLPSVYRLPVFAHNLAAYDVSRYIYACPLLYFFVSFFSCLCQPEQVCAANASRRAAEQHRGAGEQQ